MNKYITKHAAYRPVLQVFAAMLAIFALPLVLLNCGTKDPFFIYTVPFTSDEPVDGGAKCVVPGTGTTYPQTQRVRFEADVVAQNEVIACHWAQTQSQVIFGGKNVICEPNKVQYTRAVGASSTVPPRKMCADIGSDQSWLVYGARLSPADVLNWPGCWDGDPLLAGGGNHWVIDDWTPDAEAYPPSNPYSDAGDFVLGVDPPACNDPPMMVAACPALGSPMNQITNLSPCANCLAASCCAVVATAQANAKAADAQDPSMSGAYSAQLLQEVLAWLASGTVSAASYPLPGMPYPPSGLVGACAEQACLGTSYNGATCAMPQ